MNENYLTLCPHVMKLYILTLTLYSTDARRTKTSLNRSPYLLTNFLNIGGDVDAIELASAKVKLIICISG